MWTCAYCGEANPAGADRCEVCGLPPADPPSGDEPHYAFPQVPVPAPVERRPRRLALIITAAALLVAVVLAGVLLAPRLLRTEPDTVAGDQATIEPTSTGWSSPEPEFSPFGGTPSVDVSTIPAEVGVVTIDPAVTDSRTTEIATMFDTYFSGINAKDYDAVGRVLDPAGVVDPTDPAQMADFQEGTRTTQNSEITLLQIGDRAGGTLAEVAFRSSQAAGAGPKGRTDETCTRWRITYELTTTDGSYRILRGAATSRPC